MEHNHPKRAAVLPLLVFLAALFSGCSFPLLNLGLTRPMNADAATGKRNLGINLFASQVDWVEDRLFADAMRTSREWTEPGNFGNGAPVAIDGHGWPTADAEIVVWSGLGKMNGTYHLEGDSNSRPDVSTGYGDASVENFSFAGGRFSADIVYRSTEGQGLLLTFSNTGGGVRNVRLMRPKAPGSAIPYAVTTTFTTQAKELVGKFKVIRFMWSVDAWNGAWQVSWSDRVQPDYCSYNRGAGLPSVGWAGKGMPWEMAIQFCNETGKDMWLNMPLGADDDYIRQLATLVRDTYTVPDGKVYWEYSNEATWDMDGVCSQYLQTKGLDEAASAGPVGYDGVVADQQVLAARYYAERAAQMSAIWRSVWGDAEMMTRVRPVASGHLTYDTELVWGLEFVNNWYNNADGNHVPDPHPVSYYFYGCGGSHYTGDDPDSMTSGTSEIDAFEAYEEEEACLARMYGLKRCAYEGGVWSSASEYLLPRITDAMERYQRLWDKYGGDLLMYYVTTGGEEDGTALGFTQSIFQLDTPKFRAFDSIMATAKPAATAGPITPCVIPGSDFSVNSTPWEHPAPAGAVTSGGIELSEWSMFKGYLFRTAGSARHTITLAFSETQSAMMEVMVDGEVLAREAVSGTQMTCSVVLDAGLHAIRVKKVDPGYFYLYSIAID